MTSQPAIACPAIGSVVILDQVEVLAFRGDRHHAEGWFQDAYGHLDEWDRPDEDEIEIGGHWFSTDEDHARHFGPTRATTLKGSAAVLDSREMDWGHDTEEEAEILTAFAEEHGVDLVILHHWEGAGVVIFSAYFERM